MKLTATIGNIIDQTDCDALVNSANRNLRAGSGVCGAIYATAGSLLETYTTKLAPLTVGDAVASPGFDLHCRFVIHTLGPKYLFDDDPPANLARAVKSAILLADTKGVIRLAMPAISTGVYGYPAEEAVPIIVQTATNLKDIVSSLQEVRFVVTSTPMLEMFYREMRSAD